MPRDRKLDYLELYGADFGATKRFYGAAFGWSFVDYGSDYVGFADAGLDGGIQGGAPAPPLPIVYAEDLEGAVGRGRRRRRRDHPADLRLSRRAAVSFPRSGGQRTRRVVGPARRLRPLSSLAPRWRPWRAAGGAAEERVDAVALASRSR